MTWNLSTQYEKRLVAAVIVAEAGGEGYKGMQAVAEVISQRSIEDHFTFAQVVLDKRQFSCLNNVHHSDLVRRMSQRETFQTALRIVGQMELKRLPGMTNKANHFTRSSEKPSWAKKTKPVAIIGKHSFYRLKR